jgi:putative SOS response-associated peptidase YedK
MCGRFSQAQIAELDREIFRLLEMPAVRPRYNIAPSQDAAVVREADGVRRLELLRWGLIPFWAKDPAIGNRMINARAETIAAKPAFKQAFRQRRCLIPADGFYEWKKIGKGKQPHYIRLTDHRVFALAGLWERWQDDAHDPIQTFTIITTTPNAVLEPIHNRMPVVLDPKDYDQWLDPENRDTAGLAALLAPYPARAMEAYPISRYVNSPANDGPECIRPIEA